MLTGNCYCGKCSWQARGEPNWVCHCHCESCRRNCAAPFTSFFGINHGSWEWTGAAPRELCTTEGVIRYFCDTCGTPMAYYNAKWSHEVHFYLASMPEQSVVTPQFHVHWEERVPWLQIVDDLPKYAGSADDGVLCEASGP